ncbi:peptidoglycan glycosyltransferase FtsW [Lysinibacter cavernae]|uniref:Probable peptidoglycan glycosyltransferase FtsW n=1 Tax=Lysinibacter cavernae TaxID=1640652 RepID=A0A7X5R2X7_9MICO|nr:putative peptidoglycan glycosyltransferase FtsW [Lysinibacter cavernae]NIH54634.1 cell division protein FtsW [Lysinibacter cavernae]
MARILLPKPAARLPPLGIALVTVTVMLVLIGVIMVQSASSVVAIAADKNPLVGIQRQGLFAAVGLVIMLTLSRCSIATLQRFAWVGLGLGFLLQLLVYTPLGYEAGGNRNWIRVGPISGQPSEIMKFMLLVWMATVLAAKERLLGSWKHVIIPVVPVVALSVAINVAGGDLGSVLIITAVLFGALFFAQVRLRILALLALFGSLGIAVMTLMKPNRVMRVVHYLETDCVRDLDALHGLCWQPMQGLWALANGGVFGVGLGQSKAKWSWLPAAETDYIFAMIGEETGLIGAVFVLLLFVIMGGIFAWLLRSPLETFPAVILGGAFTWFATQMVVNISVVLGFLPVLGVPLPLVSAGGTSLIAGLAAIGVVLACMRRES